MKSGRGFRLLSAVLDAELFFERGLRSGQTRREQAEGRAGDIVEVDLVAELDGLWIAAMLAADADLEVRPRVAALGHGHLHQLADARLIEGGEVDGYAKVAVVIIPQEIAMRYWKIFSDSKIPVHGITISSIGLWLLYQQQPDLSDKLGAIFDLDVNHSEICLCYKTHWLTSREIPIGFAQMQRDGYVEILKQWELTKIIPAARN